jgi:mono/diheme cytochrome c family protein
VTRRLRSTRSVLGIVLAVLGIVLAVVGIVVGGLVVHAHFAWQRTWEVALPETRAVMDAEVIERGRYLVHGPAACANCHAPEEVREVMLAGEDAPLTGHPGETTLLGRWTAPNLTSDTVTGIGAMSDREIARHFRHGVNRRGTVILPFKDAFADIAEADLVAIISYLRTLPPQDGIGPEGQVNLLGKVALTHFIGPYEPAEDPPSAHAPEPTREYGAYLAHVMARCSSCHTARDLRTGAFLGAPLAGGLPFEARDRPGMVYVSPNLTPDPATGHIARWSEELFVSRMRSGPVFPGSPMPWGNFRRLTDTDVQALFAYLRSLDPVERDNGPLVQPAGADLSVGRSPSFPDITAATAHSAR